MSPFPLVSRGPLVPLMFPSCYVRSKDQRSTAKGVREAIVLGADICDGEGERAYTVYDPRLFLRRYSRSI